MSAYISLFGFKLKLHLSFQQSAQPTPKFKPLRTDPMSKCSQCKKIKPLTEFGTRQIASKHGQKGDRLTLCIACSTTNTAKRKRKRVTSDPDHPAKWFAAQPPASPSQFTEILGKHASASEIDDSWHVSLDGITLKDKGIADHIASLAWKAVGYRFR